MSKHLSDLTAYTGVLPYASELFGVYQPLLGWKSKRINRRVEQGSEIRLGDLVGRVAERVQPVAELRFIPTDCALDVTKLAPGVLDEGDGLAGTVMSTIKSKLPPPSQYTPEVWAKALAADNLQAILSGPVVTRAKEMYRELCGGAAPLPVPRLDATPGATIVVPNAAQALTTAMVHRESQVAGVLATLRDQKAHNLLHQMFYGTAASQMGSYLKYLIEAGDPFDTIDPTKVLDRVGLSPVGIAHLFRQFFFELDTFLGSPVGHVWIAPGSTVELVEVHTRRTYIEETLERSIETLQRSEKSLTTSDELSDAVKEDNRSGINLGVSVGANENWGWGSASESASFSLQTTQERSREQSHTVKREQSEKLTSEIKTNFKSTFRTVTETTDTSTKRYVLTNSTNHLVNYELRRKMRQVAVQVQDVGSYLCWQTYVDDAARDMGLAKLVHVGVPPDLAKIPQPELVVPPEAFSEDVQLTIPFLDSGDGADNDQTYEHGAEVSIGVADQVNHIVANFQQGPYHCSKPAYELTSVSLDPQSADAKLSVHNLTGTVDSGFTFVVHLDHINFNEQNSITVKATLHWEPEVDQAAIDAENAQRLALFTAREQERFRAAYLEAAQERIKFASNVTPRKFEDLRAEERIVVYRRLVQDLLTPSALVPQPDHQTQHVVAELINSIFDVDKMLYFVAPEWWRPRLHHAHQQLGGIDTMTDPVTGQQVGYAKGIPHQDVTAWGEAEWRADSYYITRDSTPAKLGSSLGWLLQLDGDDLRNMFLNAPWVKAVMPIRPGKEKAALSWLKHVEGMGTLTKDDLYQGPEQKWAGKTIFEVLDILAEQVKAKHAEGLTTADFPDPLDDSSTVRATPIDRVFEHGFDPLTSGFKAEVDGNFEVFDQWLEVLPTDQVVAVEVIYDPKTGRQL